MERICYFSFASSSLSCNYCGKNGRSAVQQRPNGGKMFGLGMPELIIILVIIVIIFGAGKLPEIGSGIGKGIKNFKKATREEEENKKIDEGKDS